jgi:hypothetical protein
MNQPPAQPFGYGYGPGGTPFYTPETVQSILDNEHLRLLRIGYFISAAQTAIFIPVGLFYAGLGVFADFPGVAGAAGAPGSAYVPLFMGIFGAAMAGLAGIAAVLKLVTAIRLKERRARLLCLITAGLSMIEIPYGSALGLMTIIVLGRPSVRQSFT